MGLATLNRGGIKYTLSMHTSSPCTINDTFTYCQSHTYMYMQNSKYDEITCMLARKHLWKVFYGKIRENAIMQVYHVRIGILVYGLKNAASVYTILLILVQAIFWMHISESKSQNMLKMTSCVSSIFVLRCDLEIALHHANTLITTAKSWGKHASKFTQTVNCCWQKPRRPTLWLRKQFILWNLLSYFSALRKQTHGSIGGY